MATRRSLSEHPVTRGTTLAVKVVATVLSAGAAAISIISFARSHGWLEEPVPAVAAAAPLPAAVWLGVWPESDTARALGDTIQLTAAIKDAHGALIPGVAAVWSSDDTEIASVDQAGTVVARREGVVNVVVAAGGHIARSRIAVRPRVAAVEIVFDSTFRIPEGEHRPATVRALDARGNRLPGQSAAWAISDTSVARVDSAGTVSARLPGRVMLEARIETVSARIEVEVVPVPGSASIMSGAGQRADAGGALPLPVVIQVLSRGGRPLGGVPVRFATDAGAGSTTAQSDLTDAQGHARANWSLGTVPGPQRLRVTVPGLDSALVLAAEADPVAANTRVSLAAEPGTAAAGDSLSAPVTIRVTDSLGTALADLPVCWTVLDGGRVTALAARTDSLGEVRARWRLGPKAGPQRARTQVGNPRRLPVFAFKTTARAGKPATATITAGDGQSGPVVVALAKPLVVRVVDRNGNVVAGTRVALHPEAGTVADSSIVTDSTGAARFRWTLGHTAGGQKLIARAEGIEGALTMTATALPLKAAKVDFAASPASAAAGRPLGKPVRVLVSDAYGNPLRAQEVWFTTRDGRVNPLKASTDAHGQAVTNWTLSGKVAPQSLAASIKGSHARDTLTIRAVSTKSTPSQPTVLH
jgi:hypothetical protein